MTYIVTGVSRGLGAAIVTQLLNRGDKVIGVGRSHNFDHDLFSFIDCDLSEMKAVDEIEFPDFSDPVTLINNAGIIGEIGRMSQRKRSDLHKVLQVNTTAPTILTGKVYDRLPDKNSFTLVNISSGAANRSIPSWAAYCASKSALNMLSETFALEERELGFNPKVYAVAPGVIDTDMQGEIRASGEENFSSIQNFIDLKESDALYSSDEAANRLLSLLDKPYSGEVFYDLRNS